MTTGCLYQIICMFRIYLLLILCNPSSGEDGLLLHSLLECLQCDFWLECWYFMARVENSQPAQVIHILIRSFHNTTNRVVLDRLFYKFSLAVKINRVDRCETAEPVTHSVSVTSPDENSDARLNDRGKLRKE